MDPHTVLENRRFMLESGEEAYAKLKNIAPITISKTLDQSRITFPVSDLFRHSCLLPILGISTPFHSEMIYDFYTNFQTTLDHSKISSRVFYTDIEFSKYELCHFLQITQEGPSAHTFALNPRSKWTEVNRVLRKTNLHTHSPTVEELLFEPRVIQQILRHTILAKAGDRPHITPLLSIVTYYVMKGMVFDVADLLIRYMANIAEIREPTSSRRINVALGHIIAHLLEKKYLLTSPTEPDIRPDFFSNRSFTPYYKGKRMRRENILGEDVEEEELQTHQVGEASGSGTHDESIEDRLSHLEVTVREHIALSREHYQRQDENWAWLKARFDKD